MGLETGAGDSLLIVSLGHLETAAVKLGLALPLDISVIQVEGNKCDFYLVWVMFLFPEIRKKPNAMMEFPCCSEESDDQLQGSGVRTEEESIKSRLNIPRSAEPGL